MKKDKCPNCTGPIGIYKAEYCEDCGEVWPLPFEVTPTPPTPSRNARDAAEKFRVYENIDSKNLVNECPCSECGEYVAWGTVNDPDCLCWLCSLTSIIQAAIDAGTAEWLRVHRTAQANRKELSDDQ